VVHVLDASRAVPVLGSLLSPEHREGFLQTLRADYERLRQEHGTHQARLLPLEEARRRRPPYSWETVDIPVPDFLGVRTLAPEGGDLVVSVADLMPYIDWSPFFHAWELRGRFPAILEDATVGERARELYADAQAMLEKIIQEKWLQPRGVYGFFPANSVGDDVEVYSPEDEHHVIARFHFLRQQMEKPANQFNHCLADYLAPRESGRRDYLGAFAVTAGHEVHQRVQDFKAAHDDYNAILLEALADRLAEAFAEYLHQKARRDWGYGRDEQLSAEDLIRERYRGIRPAAGYPACPDHSEKWTLWRLLRVEESTGIRLTESGAMWPASSVSGLYFAHPEAKYFGVGKLNRDQVLDYHLRKGMTLQEVEKWLGPYLNYTPAPLPSPIAAACACGRPH
jgi:5-methyltetrahydrofolate--homocysteine methyltransferase